MAADLEALIWEFRAAVALHRMGEARTLLEQAQCEVRRHGAPPALEVSLTLDAATFAQFVGDLPAAQRQARRLAEIGLQTDLHRFWSCFYAVRQHTLLGRFDEAGVHVHQLLSLAMTDAVGPARQPAALAELAWLEARLGRLPEAIGLCETACDRLVQLGSHPEWAADFLFDLARMQLQQARVIEEHSLGQLDTPPRARLTHAALLRRRASEAMTLATNLRAPGWGDGMLSRATQVLRELANDEHAASDGLCEHLQALTADYGANRMLDAFVWSSTELCRTHLQRQRPDLALGVLATARRQMPALGFGALREQLDYTESLVQRARGDDRRALQAYQRYAMRAADRRARVPAALRDGSLQVLCRRLGKRRAARRSQITPPVATAPNAELQALTAREADVARLMCEQLTNREISERLGLSAFTVRNHLVEVFRKLGVRDRDHARRVLSAGQRWSATAS